MTNARDFSFLDFLFERFEGAPTFKDLLLFIWQILTKLQSGSAGRIIA